jgi:hypothetical protein
VSSSWSFDEEEEPPKVIEEKKEFLLPKTKSAPSIVEKTTSLYEANRLSLHTRKSDSGVSPAVQAALANDPEEHRVMFESMFVENKKKKPEAPLLQKGSSLSIASHDFESLKDTRRYISNLSARKNPDILLPSGKFLKGNMYFKKLVTGEE